MRNSTIALSVAFIIAVPCAVVSEAAATPLASRVPTNDTTSYPLEYKIRGQLSRISGVDAQQVHIRTVHGAVTLSGTVPTDTAHDRVLIAVNRVDGVKVIRDELSVTPPELHKNGPDGTLQH